jgi:iron(III) transport system substrate-binding protein
MVYAALGYDQSVVTAFQKATGIPTKLYDDHTGIVLAKIEAEKNNPQWGVVWMDGDQNLASLDQQGMLLKGFTPNVSFNSLGTSMLPPDKSYTPTGFTISGAIIYNSKLVQTPPTTWADLLSPQWKGKVAMLNPPVDGSAFPFVAGIMQQLGGVSQGEQFFQKMKANGMAIIGDPHQEIAAVESGQYPIIIGQSPYGIGAGLKSPNIKMIYPQSVVPIPNVIGIDSKASPTVQAEAKKFVQFVFTAQAEQDRLTGDPTGDSLYWPVVQGGKQLPGLPPASTLPTAALNAYTWGAQQNAINTWWNTNMNQ